MKDVTSACWIIEYGIFDKINFNMDNQGKDFAKLVLFVRDQIREHKKDITRETSIENDLGVTGEDASELLQSFGDKFSVDISRFEFGKYFNEEPNIFTEIKPVLPLTIGHLERAIIAKRLDDDIISV